MTTPTECDAYVYAVTDTETLDHLTIRLANIRVLRPVGDRSPSLKGWFEVIYCTGLPARPQRALVDITNLAAALGWFAGFDHNRPVADAFEHRPFHPERLASAQGSGAVH